MIKTTDFACGEILSLLLQMVQLDLCSFQTVQSQDGPAPGRPAHLQDRVHPLQELHSPRHQARQLPHVSVFCCLINAGFS